VTVLSNEAKYRSIGSLRHISNLRIALDLIHAISAVPFPFEAAFMNAVESTGLANKRTRLVRAKGVLSMKGGFSRERELTLMDK
jgi:hypothetical protein